MPFAVAGFVGAVSGGMLAAIGLEALGLGANNANTLGVNIYRAQAYTAVTRGLWWWWAPTSSSSIDVYLPRPVHHIGRNGPLRQPTTSKA